MAPVSCKIVLNHVSDQRTPFNPSEYERRAREGPCFICAIAGGDPDWRRDAEAVNTGEPERLGNYCAGCMSVGLLIQAGPGRGGGRGSWRTKRSG